MEDGDKEECEEEEGEVGGEDDERALEGGSSRSPGDGPSTILSQ